MTVAAGGAQFSHCPSCGASHDFSRDEMEPLLEQAAGAVDAAPQTLPAIVYDKLIEFERQGKSLAEFEAALPELMSELDETSLAQIVQLALSTAYLQGMDDV